MMRNQIPVPVFRCLALLVPPVLMTMRLFVLVNKTPIREPLPTSPVIFPAKIVAITNIKYSQIALNWYDNLAKLGYNEMVIVATDNETVDALGNDGISRKIELEPVPTTAQISSAQLLFALRWNYVLKQLIAGTSILLTDVDNIFVRFVSLAEFAKWDVIHAYSTPWPREIFDKDGFAVCGGMMWLKATMETIAFVEMITSKCGKGCDDQILINQMLSRDLDIKWNQDLNPMEANHSGGVFKGLPYNERTGKSQVTGHTIKIWPIDFAYRGPMFPDVCPGPLNWVAMPENYGSTRWKTIEKHKLNFLAEWTNYCGNGTKKVGLELFEKAMDE